MQESTSFSMPRFCDFRFQCVDRVLMVSATLLYVALKLKSRRWAPQGQSLVEHELNQHNGYPIHLQPRVKYL